MIGLKREDSERTWRPPIRGKRESPPLPMEGWKACAPASSSRGSKISRDMVDGREKTKGEGMMKMQGKGMLASAASPLAARGWGSFVFSCCVWGGLAARAAGSVPVSRWCVECVSHGRDRGGAGGRGWRRPPQRAALTSKEEASSRFPLSGEREQAASVATSSTADQPGQHRLERQAVRVVVCGSAAGNIYQTSCGGGREKENTRIWLSLTSPPLLALGPSL